MLALADRVESLTGPDREADALVQLAVGGRIRADGVPVWDGHFIGVGAYTASLDNALKLVPEGWKLRQMAFSAPCADDRKWHLNLHGGLVGQNTFVGRGSTAALALTAAALKAHAEVNP
jgi:hypothetical protein